MTRAERWRMESGSANDRFRETERKMHKPSMRIELSKLEREPNSKAMWMLKELEGRSESASPNATWASRFIAVGGKRAATRH
jgi:hypothetical protein